MLPGLHVRSSKDDRLPVVVTFGNRKQLFAVPKLENSTDTEQTKAVLRAINDWDLADKVQIICCDTTASNIGRFHDACVLLEQELQRDLLFFGWY